MRKSVYVIAVVLLSMLFSNYPAISSDPRIALRVEVVATSGEHFRWTVRCFPNSGTHPKLKNVCNKFKNREFRDLLLQKAQESCTQIFGSNANAKITGSVYGKKVSVQLDRRDGCGIALWQKLQLILIKQ